MPEFPKVLKKGRHQVRLYQEGDRFRLRYYEGASRRSLTFAKLTDAEEEGRRVLRRLANGDPNLTPLTKRQARLYRACEAILDGIETPMDEVCRQWRLAMESLPQGVTLEQAIQGYGKAHGGVIAIPVAEAVERYLEERKATISARYFDQERFRLKRFVEAFRCELGQIERPMLAQWFGAIEGSPKTRNHYGASVRSFLRWATKRDFLPREHRLEETLDTQRVILKEFEVYTPEELSRLLDHADVRIRLRLAIVALAGLRVAEALRMTRENLRDGYVEVKGAQAKTRARRVVPVCARLQTYIGSEAEHLAAPWSHGEQYFHRLVKAAHAQADVEKKDNGLRHSFCSYRLALTQDEKKVALESGNSPEMIHRHYKALVRLEDAKAWFGVENG